MLTIPNYVIKILYFNYFAVELDRRNNLKVVSELSTVLLDLAKGDKQPFKERLNEVIKVSCYDNKKTELS